MTIESVADLQRLAAHYGLMLVEPSETLVDCLDLLAELDGMATVKQMRDHLGHGGWSWQTGRLRKLCLAGLVERRKQNGSGAVYVLTPAGLALQAQL